MNRALAETLSFLNGLIAIVIVIGGAAWGFIAWGRSIAGLLAGGTCGFVIAALACGTIAYIALIESHLAKLAGNRIDDDFGGRTSSRKEPTL